MEEAGVMLRGSGDTYRRAQLEVKNLDAEYAVEEPIKTEVASENTDISTDENEPEDPSDCIIRSAEENADTHITPTCAASFPGSGARMTWNLITALTGQ
eukprot:13141889-Ditylum_brightwellii.AAC.1